MDSLELFESTTEDKIIPVKGFHMRSPGVVGYFQMQRFMSEFSRDENGDYNDDDNVAVQACMIIYCLCDKNGDFFYGPFNREGQNTQDSKKRSFKSALSVVTEKAESQPNLFLRLFQVASDLTSLTSGDDEETEGNDETVPPQVSDSQLSATSNGSVLLSPKPEVIEAP